MSVIDGRGLNNGLFDLVIFTVNCPPVLNTDPYTEIILNYNFPCVGIMFIPVQYTDQGQRAPNNEKYKLMFLCQIFLSLCLTVNPPSQRVCRGQNRHKVSPPQRHQSSKRGQPHGNPRVQKWDRELLRLEGASVGCAGCTNSQPNRPADET